MSVWATVQADLSSAQDVKRLVDVAQRQLGELSFCVDLASDYPRTPYQLLTAADWDRAMAALGLVEPHEALRRTIRHLLDWEWKSAP